jgi:hypothetical protein
LISAICTTLRRLVAGGLALSLVTLPLSNPGSATASGYVIDSGVYAPPSSGPYAYYPSYGAFGPDQSSFPRAGESFVDPVFGTTIRRLTNELGQHSFSEIYSKNGFFNADGTLVHHRTPSGHNIISTRTGQVVRAGIDFNSNSSFAPDNPDAWYYFAYGDTTLYKYSVSTGNRTAVKTFPGALGRLGGSTDWIDRSGRYMVLNIDNTTRVYDVQSDVLYAGAIPGTYGGSTGWSSISPDASYVITSTPPRSSHSWRIDHATRTVSTTPVLFWTLCGGHADVVSASNGKTYFVSFDCNSTASVYAVDVTLPQSPTNVQQQVSQNRKLFQAAWADSGHFSRVSRGALQDWMFVSVESGDDDFSATTASWRPFKQEIVMANVLSGEVRRVAHHRSRGLSASTYYYQPRVSTTWDGSVVLWTSNFGYSTDGYADLYAVNVDGAGGATSGGSTPTPSPVPASPTGLTVSFVNPSSGATVSGTTNVLLSAGYEGSTGTGYTYTLSAGGTTLYVGTNNGFSWDTTSSPSGSVTLTAKVSDAAGNSATATQTVTVANPTAGGTTAPTVAITTPTNGAWTGAGIYVGAQASSTAKLTKIELWGAGKVFATLPCSATSCTPAKIRWETGTLPNGAYLVNAVAYDEAGARATSAAITIYKNAKTPTYASGAPTTTIAGTTTTTSGTTSGGTTTSTSTTTSGETTTSEGISTSVVASPPPGDSTAPTAAITSPASGTWTGNSLKVSMKGTDNVAMKTVTLYANGVPANAPVLACSGATCEGTVTWRSGTLPRGKHTLTAVAMDTAGNTTTSAPVTINK